MAKKLDDLLRSALELDEEGRAELAARLIDSLDDTRETGVEGAWRREIERRMKELDSGAADTIAWDAARGRLFSGREN